MTTTMKFTEMIKCPFCENGSYDTGGQSPWGEWLRDRCDVCSGTGMAPVKRKTRIIAIEYESVYELGEQQVPEMPHYVYGP